MSCCLGQQEKVVAAKIVVVGGGGVVVKLFSAGKWREKQQDDFSPTVATVAVSGGFVAIVAIDVFSGVGDVVAVLLCTAVVAVCSKGKKRNG